MQTLLISASLGQTCWPYLIAPVLEQRRLVQLSVVKNNSTKCQICSKILETNEHQHLTEIMSHSILTLFKDKLLQVFCFHSEVLIDIFVIFGNRTFRVWVFVSYS